MVLKLKVSCSFLKKLKTKNETESKTDNPAHSFRETSLVVQLIWELQIKGKIVMSCISRVKKEGIFCTVYFVRRKFFLIFVLSQCIVYWIHFQNIYTFIYQNTLLHSPFFLAFKIVESLLCIVNLQVKTNFIQKQLPGYVL